MLGEFPLPTFFLQESFRVQLRPIRTAKSLPHMIPDRRKAVLFAGCVKALFKCSCQAVLEPLREE
eukprot:scaffold26781_cov14-Tisochrysis_lutea.AAC.1